MLDNSSNSETMTCSTISKSLVSNRFSAGAAGQRKSKGDTMILSPERKRDNVMRIPQRGGDPARNSPKKDEGFVRQTPRRTVSLPRRAVWKDKGGSARYTLRDETTPEEVKPASYGETAKSAMTDAFLSGSVAGLVVLETVESAAVATRSLTRQWSQKMIVLESETPAEAPEDDNEIDASVDEGALVRGGRGLLRRAKSLSTATSSGFASLQRMRETSATVASIAA